MARKHAKKFVKKQPVTQVLVRAAVLGNERIAREVPAGTEGAHAITQDDGSVKHFIVERNVVSPAVYKNVANGPTMVKGNKNVPPSKKGGK